MLVLLATVADAEQSIKERVDSLRCEGRYEAAAAVAESLIAAQDQAGDSLKAADARRLAATLHTAAAAPEALRRRLAEGDCASSAIDSLARVPDYAEAARLVQLQLASRIDVFGAEHDEVAVSLNDLAVIRKREGRFPEAESIYADAFSIRRNALGENHPNIAQILNNLGALHKEQGKYLEAEEDFRRTLAIRRQHLSPDDPALATPIHNLATTITALGKFAEADTLLRESLEIKKRAVGEATPSYAWTLMSLADIQDKLGDRGSAEAMYRRALSVMYAAHDGDYDHIDVADARQELGMHLEEQGDHEAARELVDGAFQTKRRILGDNHPQVLISLANLSVILDNLGEFAQAESLARQAHAMQVARFGTENPSCVSSLATLALLKSHTHAYTESESLFNEALDIARVVYPSDHPEIARLQLNLAISRRWLGDYAGAAPLIEEALAIRRQAFGEMHPRVASALRQQGHLRLAMGDLDGAASSLTQAAEAFESARVRAGTGLGRAFLAQPNELMGNEPPHTLLAAVQLLRGRPQDAWPAVERDRGRVLADLLLDADRRALTAEEREAERALERELMNLEREFEALRKSARAGKSDPLVEDARGRLIDAETRWTVFQRELAAKYPIVEGQVYSLERVQAALPPRTAIIGWLDVNITGDSCAAWGYVVRRDGPVSWYKVADVGSSATGRPKWLQSYVEALRDRGSAKSKISEGARRLCDARFAPLEPALADVRDLIVVPTGPTNAIPIETLIDANGQPLSERFAISYIPSSTVFAWLTERSRERRPWKRALLLGDPPFSDEALEDPTGPEERGAPSNLPQLPWTRQEVAAIDSVLEAATCLLGAEASEGAIVQRVETGELAEYDVFHFATHAIVDHRRPERSALVLSLAKLPDPETAAINDDRIIDGLLTAKEVLREWHTDADLVTLSACESGLGKEVGGEGTVGFSQAFFQAGARSVLVSLWRVDDRSTSLLMRRFYENATGAYRDTRAGHVGTQMSKAEALREAKSWLRGYRLKSGNTPYSHPSYWSPFILIGSR